MGCPRDYGGAYGRMFQYVVDFFTEVVFLMHANASSRFLLQHTELLGIHFFFPMRDETVS